MQCTPFVKGCIANTPEAIRTTATVIAETIAENELDLVYIERSAAAL